jgi:hypothetical protein
MRRSDHPGSTPNAAPMFWSQLSHAHDPLTWKDHSPGAHRIGEADEPASLWESAWIDLGGEG